MTEFRGFEENYLGDGLYVSFDGYHIILRTSREPGIDHWVALEPPVWTALVRYVHSLKEAT